MPPDAPGAEATPAMADEPGTASVKVFSESVAVWLWGLCITGTTFAYMIYNLVMHARDRAALEDPYFCLLVGAVWTCAYATAWRFRRPAHPVADVLLSSSLALAAVGVLAWSLHWINNPCGSARTYCVGLFDFGTETSDHELYKKVREGLRQIELASEESFVPAYIPRMPSGNRTEQRQDALYWARLRGCHLALVREGASDLRFLQVRPYGEVRFETMKPMTDYLLTPAEVPQNSSVDRIAGETVRYWWGVRTFQQGDTRKAISILEGIDGSNAKFYAGLAWVAHCGDSKGIALCLDSAERDFKTALDLWCWKKSEKEGLLFSCPGNSMEAASRRWLANTFFLRLRSKLSAHPQMEYKAAQDMYASARTIYTELKEHSEAAAIDLSSAELYRQNEALSPTLLKSTELLVRGTLGYLSGSELSRAHLALAAILADQALMQSAPAKDVCLEAHARIDDALKFRRQNDAHHWWVFGYKAAETLGRCAFALHDSHWLGRAMQIYSEAEAAASAGGFERGLLHYHKGTTLDRWARALNETDARFDRLDAAAREFRTAADFLVESAAIRGEATQRFALVRVEQASQAAGARRTDVLRDAHAYLTEALKTPLPNKVELLKQRAHILRLLATCEKDGPTRNRYFDEARSDESAAAKEPRKPRQ